MDILVKICGGLFVIAIISEAIVLLISYLNLRARGAHSAKLLNFLKDEDEYVRGSIVKTLGEIGHSVAIPELLKVLHDESPSVRELAVKSLGQIDEAPYFLPPFCYR